MKLISKSRGLISGLIGIGLLLIVCLLQSCKFYSFSGTSIHPNVKTFSVGFFENNAPINSPMLSQSITEELKQKFISETNLSIVEELGDYDFTGSIVNFDVAPVSAQSTDNAQLNRLTIAVKVQLKCEKDPSMSFDQQFSNFKDFDATENFSTVEDDLVDEITEMLIQQIFNKAAINW